MNPSISDDKRKAKAELARVIGARLREARRLCNMRPGEAARRLGYATSSMLSKIEHANVTDSMSVPLSILLAASKLYDVSLDWLFGEADDWERDVRSRNVNATALWPLEANQKHIARELAEIRRIAEKLHALETVVAELSGEAETLLTAFLVFWDRNPALDDMPGGAPVVAALERTDSAARRAKAALNKLKKETPLYA
jgi:transcriptional regulator with XRE-family HTH domain